MIKFLKPSIAVFISLFFGQILIAQKDSTAVKQAYIGLYPQHFFFNAFKASYEQEVSEKIPANLHLATKITLGSTYMHKSYDSRVNDDYYDHVTGIAGEVGFKLNLFENYYNGFTNFYLMPFFSYNYTEVEYLTDDYFDFYVPEDELTYHSIGLKQVKDKIRRHEFGFKAGIKTNPNRVIVLDVNMGLSSNYSNINTTANFKREYDRFIDPGYHGLALRGDITVLANITQLKEKMMKAK